MAVEEIKVGGFEVENEGGDFQIGERDEDLEKEGYSQPLKKEEILLM